MAVADAQATPAVSSRLGASRRLRLAILVGLWLGLALFYVLIQTGRDIPTVFNDEQVFGRAAQNLAHGDGYTWRHVSAPLRSIYPFVISPAWVLFDGMAAYRVALIINALIMTAALFPAYVIARRLTGYGYAVAAATATVLVPSMVWSGMLMTESLAYPLATLALLATVEAMRRPGARTALPALAAIAAAAATRSQLLVLGPVFVGALGFDLLRFAGGELRERVRAHRLTLVALALAALALIGLVVAGPLSSDTIFGPYAVSSGKTVDVGSVLDFLVQYVGGLSGAVLGLPLVAAIALAARRANWRDPETGPLLATALAAVLLLIAIGAWFASVESKEVQERYVFYAMPLLAACWVGLPGRAGPRAILLASAALALAVLVFFPGFIRGGDWEGWVQFGLSRFGDSKHVFVALLLGLGAAAALAVRLRGAEAATLLIAPLLLLGMFTVHQGQRAANADSRLVEVQIPKPLDWIDRETDGPAALMGLPKTSLLHIADFELWNRNLDRLFTFPTEEEVDLAGPSCHAVVAKDGSIRAAPDCPLSLPSNLVFAEERTRIAMQNARRVVEPGLSSKRSGHQYTRYGELFIFQSGDVPRIRSLIRGCSEDFCPGRVSVDTWSRTAGTVRVTLELQLKRGPAEDHVARVGGRRVRFNSEGQATATIGVEPGTDGFTIEARRPSGDFAPFDLLAADYRSASS